MMATNAADKAFPIFELFKLIPLNLGHVNSHSE